MFNRDKGLSLPFPLNILPYIMIAMWAGVLISLVYIGYVVISADLQPEDVGQWLGRFVAGFKEAAQ